MKKIELECSFLIPERRDPKASDGRPHASDAWSWLDEELFARFGRRTLAPGWFEGFYRDLDTGARVDDRSRKFTVAVSRGELDKLRGLLLEACERFAQKCIYLTVAGEVECVGAEDAGK